jgi:ribosomal protein S18 acetylase RimI-like enzyme
MIEIKKANELGESSRKQISEIFVEGFGDLHSFFSKDRRKLAIAFEHMFVLDVFYVALVDGEIAGITACTDGKIMPINHSKKELKNHLGFLKGTFAYSVFKREFQKPPIEVGGKKAWIEFVATSAKYRGKGVATAIMNHIFTLSQYNEYILVVADNNTNALKMYEKLGYKEFKRIKHKYSKYSGIDHMIYMEYK